MARITLKHVAAEAGISISCTARALKGRAGISEATRHRVREIAERLGYRPDPMLSALAAYREQGRKINFQGIVAYLAYHPSESQCLLSPQSGDPLLGARERAALLGYQIQFVSLNELPDAPERLWKRLINQGISGAVLRSFPLDPSTVAPPENMPCIDLFSQPHVGILPTVSSNHAQSMELVLHRLRKRGFKRPGLVLNMGISSILHHGWYRTFSSYSEDFEAAPISRQEGFPADPAALENWIGREHPDALIFCFSEDRMPARKHLSRWKRQGISSLCMDLLDPDCGIPGIHQDRKQAGAEAFSILHGMMVGASLGIRRIPLATLLPGTWKEGSELFLIKPLRAAHQPF